MSAPMAVQKLKHGKALCGKTFGQFVETFNWLVDFCLSLKGDRDSDPDGNGRVQVDRADPSAPIIRLASSSVGGGGSGPDVPEEEEEYEPGANPEEPYSDPEDTFDDDPEAINGNGNSISSDITDLGTTDANGAHSGGGYCNSIFGGAPGGLSGGNEISITCSKK